MRHAECVCQLISVSDSNADGSAALFRAAREGYAECVKLLLSISDPNAEESAALRAAAAHGHAECFKLLIPVSLPLIEIEAPPLNALSAGHACIISIMLDCEPRILDKVDLPSAIKAAVAKGQTELAALLLSIVEHESIAASVGRSASCRTDIPQRL